MDKHILIATDGSMFSNHALAYAARLFADRPEVSLRIVHCIHPPQRPLPEPQDSRNSLFPCSVETAARHGIATRCLEQAKQRLIRAGIAADRIIVSVLVSGNTAQAIQIEAERRMVDAVLVARRGIGFIGEMLLGSVSADLFRKCRQIPLWIIDGEVAANNILVSVDGACPSLMAVDHLAHIIAERQDIQIFLYHCLRLFRGRAEKRQPPRPKWSREWCRGYQLGDNPIFDGPCRLLQEAGIPEYRITVLPETPIINESSSILHQARKHRCGTVVIGRRTAGFVKGLWGEVAARTIKNTQNMALWVVG